MTTWEDLLDIPYTEDGCYDVARLALAKFGVRIPADPWEHLLGPDATARELAAGEAPRGSDMVVMETEAGLHIGVMIDGERFIHAHRIGGSRIDRLALWQRAQKIRRVLRIERANGGDA